MWRKSVWNGTWSLWHFGWIRKGSHRLEGSFWVTARSRCRERERERERGTSKNKDAAAEVLNWIVSNRETIVEFTKSRNFGAWLMPLYYEASDFGDDVDPRLRDYLVDFSERTGNGFLCVKI